MVKIAVLDDWQGVARQSADWSALEARVEELVVFEQAFADEEFLVAALAEFDILLTMRERTAFPARVVARLPKLKMLGITGPRAPAIDIAALRRQGVVVCSTGAGGDAGQAPAELALGLMLAAARSIPQGDAAIRAGRFQEGTSPQFTLSGRTLGLIGLGRTGTMMARYGQALGMSVVAWSPNLTSERAEAGGARLLDKDTLLSSADVVSLHLVLSERTRAILGEAELALMRPGSILVNISRGPLVEEAAMLAAASSGRITLALDVYHREPLAADHPLRSLKNTVLTPHFGYTVSRIFEAFYRESIENALAFLDGAPIRVMDDPAQ